MKIKKTFKDISSFVSKHKLFIILSFAVIGIFVLPYIITNNTWLYDLRVTKSNEIGDTIGGILSPFIGLVSAVLIYFTIEEQIKANKIIQRQFIEQQRSKFEETIFNETNNQIDKILIDANKVFIDTEKRIEEKRKDPKDPFVNFFNSLYRIEAFPIIPFPAKYSVPPNENKEYTLEFNYSYLPIFQEFIEVLEQFCTNIHQEQAYHIIYQKKILRISKEVFGIDLEQSLWCNTFIDLENNKYNIDVFWQFNSGLKNLQLLVRFIKILDWFDEKLQVITKVSPHLRKHIQFFQSTDFDNLNKFISAKREAISLKEWIGRPSIHRKLGMDPTLEELNERLNECINALPQYQIELRQSPQLSDKGMEVFLSFDKTKFYYSG